MEEVVGCFSFAIGYEVEIGMYEKGEQERHERGSMYIQRLWSPPFNHSVAFAYGC